MEKFVDGIPYKLKYWTRNFIKAILLAHYTFKQIPRISHIRQCFYTLQYYFQY